MFVSIRFWNVRLLMAVDWKVEVLNLIRFIYFFRRSLYFDEKKVTTKEIENRSDGCYSNLMREVQKACKKNKMKVKVVEKMRSTVKGELQRSNPFKFTKCGRGDCPKYR